MKYLLLWIPASFRVFPSLSLFRLGPFIMRNFFLLSHLYVYFDSGCIRWNLLLAKNATSFTKLDQPPAAPCSIVFALKK